MSVMTNASRVTETGWTSVQAYTISVICLLVGIAGGWFIRASLRPKTASAEANASQTTTAGSNAAALSPTPGQIKQMADAQAAPLLERLKSDPNNAELLANIGNLYYDDQQYPSAIKYYKKSLELQPTRSAVRTDMGTAYWYVGNADAAIEEFNRVLKVEPTNPNTLFNLGIVRLHGKMDVDGAVAAWQKLLDNNPNYENNEKVRELIRQAKKH
jgi:cytochrome c-type biogenesis protein CcmH/NrfG